MTTGLAMRRRIASILGKVRGAIARGRGIGATLVRGAFPVLRESGLGGFVRAARALQRGEGPPLLTDPQGPDRFRYREWIRRYGQPAATGWWRLTDAAARVRAEAMTFTVLMPLDAGTGEQFARAVASVRQQVHPNWTLHLVAAPGQRTGLHGSAMRLAAEDARIAYCEAPLPQAIASVATPWLALLDARDALAPDALLRVAEALVSEPQVRLVYSDEDRVDAHGQRSAGWFKPDWNLDLLRSQDFMSRLAVHDARLVREVGGLDAACGEAAPYDLVLRCVERLAPAQIAHVPQVLYHRHVAAADNGHADLSDGAPAGGEQALQAHLARCGVAGAVQRVSFGFKVRYALPADAPLVSLIIPTRNALALVRQCIESILAKTAYPRFEIILVDNGSDDPEALRYFDALARRPDVRVLRDDGPFNYSALNNRAAAIARGEFLGLVNNDIEVIAPEWLVDMVGIALQPGVGAVGARLWYPDRTLQHGGVVLGYRGGVANHAHRGLRQGEPGYFGRAALTQSFSAVTAACLVVRKRLYDELGGLDEEHLTVAFNDIDFCLRLREAGYRNVWTPEAELFHHESATRVSDFAGPALQRFLREEQFMRRRWGALLTADPAYNPNLSLAAEDFSYAWPPRNPWLPPST
ncbi:glycosyltransferase family 2 protein [Variovorax paradoxus]|uniref:glycosyltransferase family 2 protein n=1 Tax=Variovorax paradoxus TaxID=34073 RepID=UPI00278A129A|nr:glycosyltransferase [Variovorax paradoxus]MDQ0587762.1 GT2 family glycosyltransferase [Variovorax paradoxus]